MAAKKKKITLSEFKTWLAGVQSMQPDDWHPSKENWKMILEQVENITEIAPKVQRPPEPDRSAQTSNLSYDNPANPANHHRPAQQAYHQPPVAPPEPVGASIGDDGGISLDIKDTGGGFVSSFAD